jgi:hypothetical protein
VPRALPAGTVLDRHYLVGRVLGAGGFGITYLCADTRLQQPVAVKEYLPRDWAARRADGRTACAATERDADDYQGGLEKFLREARILAKLSEHPNIVPVLNFFEEHGTGYMVMRYLEGHTLDAVRRARGGRIAAAEAVPYILAVLDGLRAVHEVGLVHRDVKPQNVFVTTAGQVKLFDFGSARYWSGDQSGAMSRTFTPGFAPFEQYHSAGREGPETDIYAVGASLHLLLSGSMPPEAPSRFEGAELPALDQPPHAVASHQVAAAVTRALGLRPADRFRSAMEFQRALMAPPVAAERPPETPPEAPRYAAGRAAPAPRPAPAPAAAANPRAAAAAAAARPVSAPPAATAPPRPPVAAEPDGELAPGPAAGTDPAAATDDAPPPAVSRRRGDPARRPAGGERPAAAPATGWSYWVRGDGLVAALAFLGAWASAAFTRVAGWGAWSDGRLLPTWLVGLTLLVAALAVALRELARSGITRWRAVTAGLLLGSVGLLFVAKWAADAASLAQPYWLAVIAAAAAVRWRVPEAGPAPGPESLPGAVVRVAVAVSAGLVGVVGAVVPDTGGFAHTDYLVFFGVGGVLAGACLAAVGRGDGWLGARVGRGLGLLRALAAPAAVALLAGGGFLVSWVREAAGADWNQLVTALGWSAWASVLATGAAALVLLVRRRRRARAAAAAAGSPAS